MYKQAHSIEDKTELAEPRDIFALSPYPVDLLPTLALARGLLDADGVSIAGYHPISIVQYALVHWNRYLRTDDVYQRQIFLEQAYWLVEHEARIGNDAGGWPIYPDVGGGGPWLSALAQGNALSVLVRAYQLTREQTFLEVAHRVARTFGRDILDGGVSAPIGGKGIFFEEVATYPATHLLCGFMLALFGLYDYAALTRDVQIKELIRRGLLTLHVFLNEFDTGYWTRSGLLHRRLSSHAELALQAALLEALAMCSGCEHCSALALRWRRYHSQFGSRLRYLIACSSRALWRQIRSALFPGRRTSGMMRVCVPITAFPVTGGMRTVLARIAQVTKASWQIEYLTHSIGPHADGFILHQFGTRKMGPWQFPSVWLYVLAGFRKLVSLLCRGAGYDIILLQDGVYTAAFAALAAWLAGIHSVCIDHGNLSLLNNSIYRAERIHTLATKQWPQRLLASLQYVLYWPSLRLFAWFGARFVDHYFIPGVSGDGVEEVCKSLGVPASRITRFANMIDIERHVIPDAFSRARAREKMGIPSDGIVITIICRLAPEKGLEIALEAVSQALSALSPDLRARIRVMIAGDGPLRRQIEEEIGFRNLSQTCLLWGEASAEEVITLLGVSDIFLFTSWRAAGYPLAVMEAMASGCAVVAATESLANQSMLAEGRGIALPVGDVEQTSRALVQLVKNPELCRQMGGMARNYIATEHNATVFKRAVMRVTCWSALDEFLHTRE